MKFIYPAIIHDDADGFWAEFPDLEYTSSTGSTLTELELMPKRLWNCIF